MTHRGTVSAGEFKQVTVLCAGVVDAMGLAEAVGAERLREVMIELIDTGSAVIRRYGGTVQKSTGDGFVAVFGAPVSLEDHAFRACHAALEVMRAATELARATEARDRVAVQLRIGLHSGEVIAGEIASGVSGSTTVGTAAKMAQQTESVAAAGTVMLGETTARLIEHAAILDAPEPMQTGGSSAPVRVRRLRGMTAQGQAAAGSRSTLIGREIEVHTLAARLDRAVNGRGCLLNMVGPAGIGKTRLVGEVVELAESRGIAVFSTQCESHTSDIAFTAVTRLFRDVAGVDGLTAEVARAVVRSKIPDADAVDLRLLDDLLGIADPESASPNVVPDARRRRVTALVNAAQLARDEPALFIVEDAHWVDEVSESMLADFFGVIRHTSSLVVTTFRPDYRGTLAQMPNTQTVWLAPLADAEIAALLDELLGSDPSVRAMADVVVDRAAGNPLFAEEIVRDLADRAVLQGQRGAYVSHTRVTSVRVPATVQAAIAARVDRLGAAAKQTLNAAAVIGSRFTPDLLRHLGITPALEELVNAELVDQVNFIGCGEYAFHHPLIHSVAYETQLQADRATMHRRLAKAIESSQADAIEANAALIAEHLEAAGDLDTAYGWHMRAGAWATNRDLTAARRSWERAGNIADTLAADHPNRLAMRIAPRTILCGTAWRFDINVVGAGFDELRELCRAAGDDRSLAVAMAGRVIEYLYRARPQEASQLATEAMALIESIADPALTVGLSFSPVWAMIETAGFADVLRWSQQVIDLADGDAGKGDLLIGSPLAVALCHRAIGRYCLGLKGWRDDFSDGLAMARDADPMSHAAVVAYTYLGAIPYGVLTPDDGALREMEIARRNADHTGDDHASAYARAALGLALVHRGQAVDRYRGYELLGEVSTHLRHELNYCDLQIVSAYWAREQARHGDRDDAITVIRAAVDALVGDGILLSHGVSAAAVLVEALLDRGADGDVTYAQNEISRLECLRADGHVIFEIVLLRLRALVARARQDPAAYADYRDRYREMARSLDFQGHLDWATAMP